MSNVALFPTVHKQTDETGQTEAVTNEQFLSAIFPELPSDVRPMLVSFGGNHGVVKGVSWGGYAWSLLDPQLVETYNNYFSISAFTQNEQGEYRRKKNQFAACYCIVLDDVGVKVAREAIGLEPSWMLETSPDNYHVGYILADPIVDPARADALMKAVIDAGLCDPGASGPTARLARLPGAVNGKYDPAFICRLESWQPELRYTEEELIVGLGLTVDAPKSAQKLSSTTYSPFIDDVWQPKPEANPVVAALQACNLYKTPLGEGKHDITCPWVREHTGAVDGGTAYFEPTEDWPFGGFNCLHGHCQGRSVCDLLEVLNVDAQAARMRPVIKIIDGDLHRAVDAAEKVLSSCGHYYQRGGCIVTINTQPETMRTQIKHLTPNSLTHALGRTADWKKFDGRQKEWVRKDPPARHANILNDSSQFRYLPALSGLALQPYLRENGSIVKVPGYDESAKIFGVFDARQFDVCEAPSRADALQALSLLNELLEEFEFAAPEDRSGALSAMLTAAVRPSLPQAPMFHIKGTMPGTGKTFFCRLITLFAAPHAGAASSFPDNDTECQKLLVAELINGPPVIEFDNITMELAAHKSLCTALTSGLLTGRILGSSKTVTVSTRTLFLSSGNNVGPVDDMTRRCITINLASASEMPAQRTFKNPNLIEDVSDQRGKYVSAALTIVRAWIHVGKPMTECKPLAGYAQWAEWCRQPLLWLGYPDPVQSIFTAMNHDPGRELLGRFLAKWDDLCGAKPFSVREVMKLIERSGDAASQLAEVLDDIAGERERINRHRLGKWLSRHASRPVDGRYLVAASSNTQAVQWSVRAV